MKRATELAPESGGWWLNLSDMYRYGTGTKKSIPNALEWFEKSAEGGDNYAMANIAYIYSNGNGVPVDYRKAFEWYKQSAEAGNVNAMNNLGYAYDTGLGVAVDYEQAAYWYKQAAEAGDEIAKENLQRLYDKVNRNNSGGGCFITTAVCENFGKPDDCYELTTFRNFRDGWLTAQPDGKALIAEYYSVAPKIVDKINRLPNVAQIYQNLWRKYLAPCLALIESGDNSACKRLYVEMVMSLKKKFLNK